MFFYHKKVNEEIQSMNSSVEELLNHVQELTNEIKNIKNDNSQLQNQINSVKKEHHNAIETFENEVMELVEDGQHQKVLNKLVVKNDQKLTLLLETYSNAIKNAVKIQLEKELTSTDTSGKLVRYQKDLNTLFPTEYQSKKILVTATMSAGKSMLINALVGKEILKSRNEATTGKIYHILNSMSTKEESNRFETELERDLSDVELEYREESDDENEIYISTSFNNDIFSMIPIEFIDTPGVNYVLEKKHEKMTKNHLEKQEYDLLIYVINATQNGVNDDRNYLDELQKRYKKVIFVLNKLDEFDNEVDSTRESLEESKLYLESIGFLEPLVVPLSAYAALLAKKVIFDSNLTEFQKDKFRSLSRKFNGKHPFHLDNLGNEKDSHQQARQLIIHSGLQRLEETIYTQLYGG